MSVVDYATPVLQPGALGLPQRDDWKIDAAAPGDAPAALFVVESVVLETDGPAPAFVYRGALRTAEGGDSPGLELYIGHELASPKARRRSAGGAAPAPYRVELRAACGALVHSLRGLPPTLAVDAALGLAAWGAAVAVAFPAGRPRGALARLAAGLRGVRPHAACLGGHPAAALLAPRPAGLVTPPRRSARGGARAADVPPPPLPPPPAAAPACAGWGAGGCAAAAAAAELLGAPAPKRPRTRSAAGAGL